MSNLVGEVRYAVRQLLAARVFTITAVLTLALGIGGTTAIFTLIHAVMLRSLPVTDPERLYRIGDGNSCCVQGGPQDRWGMYSYPLYERLKAELPEFEELTAFQAGGARLSARRQDTEATSRAIRAQYVTGSYFSTLGVKAFGGRVFAPDDDRAAATPVAVMSHHLWKDTYGGDPTVVGATFVLEGHPFTIVGVTPPGFFGETLRGDPPDLWVPLQQEPLLYGDTSILRQPISAWLRVIGRIRPGAKIDGVGPRLTGILHQWLQHDSGYPSNWMPGRHPGPAAAGDRGRSRGLWCRRDEGAVRTQPAASPGRVRARVAHRLRQRRQSTPRPRRRPPRADSGAARHRRVATADRDAGARGERAPCDCRRPRRSRRRRRHRAVAAGPGLRRRDIPANRHVTRTPWCWLRILRWRW